MLRLSAFYPKEVFLYFSTYFNLLSAKMSQNMKMQVRSGVQMKTKKEAGKNEPDWTPKWTTSLSEKQQWLYLVLGIREGYAEGVHGSDHGLHGQVDVLVDQFGVAPLVLICVSSSVDDPHLFDEGALSALSGSCWIQQCSNEASCIWFYFISATNAVEGEVLLDVSQACL